VLSFPSVLELLLYRCAHTSVCAATTFSLRKNRKRKRTCTSPSPTLDQGFLPSFTMQLFAQQHANQFFLLSVGCTPVRESANQRHQRFLRQNVSPPCFLPFSPLCFLTRIGYKESHGRVFIEKSRRCFVRGTWKKKKYSNQTQKSNSTTSRLFPLLVVLTRPFNRDSSNSAHDRNYSVSLLLHCFYDDP
jgi:hypothetical protein